MKHKLSAVFLGLALVTLSGSSFAFGLGNLIGAAAPSAGSGASTVTAESLVTSYVTGSQYVLNAQGKFAGALGLKAEAEKAELAAKNLTSGATSSGLEDAAKVQTESSKAIADAQLANKGQMSAESKKTYTAGILTLAMGIKSYMGMSSDISKFTPSVTSLGAAAGSAVYIVKNLPGNLTTLKDTLKSTINFAKENKIEVPADATSLLPV